MATTKDSVRKHLLKNPHLTNRELAEKFNTTPGVIKTYKATFRKEKILPSYDPIEGRSEKNKKVAGATAKDRKLPDEDIKARMKELFKGKGTRSLEELSDHFDKGIGKIRDLIEELIKGGHNLQVTDGAVLASNIIPKSAPVVLNVKKMSTNTYRFGVCGDNHLCSKYERMDVLNALYDQFEEQGITTVYNTGNWIDGEARFNIHDLLVHGMDNQIDYFLEHYPNRKGIKTMLITGDDHEGWYTQREGVDIGKIMELKARGIGRNDLVYLGHMEADIILKAKNGQTMLRVLHPGGGSAYATSYTAQKIVESYTGGEKPDILLLGHYHKAEYSFIRGVHTIQTGTTEDQTPFMRKKRLAAHLGGWIIEFSTDDRGAVTRFKQEFFPFYDNAYYQKWAYKWK